MSDDQSCFLLTFTNDLPNRNALRKQLFILTGQTMGDILVVLMSTHGLNQTHLIWFQD